MTTKLGRDSFRLLYGDVDLGVVRYGDSDFPSSFGTWSPPETWGATQLCRHLRDYIEYSIASLALLDATNAGPEWQDLAAREEARFQDLIDSRLWTLIGAEGEAMRILIPLFRANGDITWRYDHDP